MTNVILRSLGALAAQMMRPYAALLRMFSGRGPRFDTDQFPWIRKLEANLDAMREEFLDVREESVPSLSDILSGKQRLASDGWRLLAMRYWSYDLTTNCQVCPRTWELVRGIPGMTTAAFSVLEAGEHIPAHRGVFPGLLRCHVPLFVPFSNELCRIRIGQESHHWRTGEAILFDDSFEHEVWNESDQPRVVLLVDVKRPLPQPLRLVNDVLTRVACGLFVACTTTWSELSLRPTTGTSLNSDRVDSSPALTTPTR